MRTNAELPTHREYKSQSWHLLDTTALECRGNLQPNQTQLSLKLCNRQAQRHIESRKAQSQGSTKDRKDDSTHQDDLKHHELCVVDELHIELVNATLPHPELQQSCVRMKPSDHW